MKEILNVPKCCETCAEIHTDKTKTPCVTCSRNTAYTDHYKPHDAVKNLCAMQQKNQEVI